MSEIGGPAGARLHALDASLLLIPAALVSAGQEPDTEIAMKYKVIIVHNTYEHRGGEDSVVDEERRLLESYGHETQLYSRNNSDIKNISKIALAGRTIWSTVDFSELGKQIADFGADLVHVHNTFPLISPSIYWKATNMRVPIVQTLHNFRLLCPQAMFLREGKICEKCIGRFPWPSVLHGCYRSSRVATGALASMVSLHRILGTWQKKIPRYIALNDFCRNKFIAGGLPASRISVKPNFVSPPSSCASGYRDGFLFVGRLSSEKGISTLADACRRMRDFNMKVAGDGPEDELMRGITGVDILGRLDSGVIEREMLSAACLIVPSIWYENFPRTIVEAFACGLPVIASRIGALQELIVHGETGLLFEAGNSSDLLEKMEWAKSNPHEMKKMGDAAKAEYERLYTPAINYSQLMDIYSQAIEELDSEEFQRE